MTDQKTHARSGSKWNSTNRLNQKRLEEPKGFARGATVTRRPVSTDHKQPLENKPK